MLRKPVPTGKGFRDLSQLDRRGIAIGFVDATATAAAISIGRGFKKVAPAVLIGIGGIVGFSVPSPNYLNRVVTFVDPILVISGFF